ncbi:MAG: diguanylate cyclase domain-containing protein [Dehalococcoidia bacterium]
MTTSIGIALFPDNGSDLEALLISSDRAMYRAKANGGNDYRLWS